MRLIIPLPFGELEIRARKTRRARPFFWFMLLSGVLHFFAVALLALFVFRHFVPLAQPKQQPVMVSISSATRIQHRSHPIPAQKPLIRPVYPRRELIARRETARPSQEPKRVVVRPHAQQPATLTTAQIQAQTLAYERTIAQAKAADDPVAGAASSKITPTASRPTKLNIDGSFGRPQPEGVLYPEKRWVDGPYAYYYVRYTAEYADGTIESGDVPWPIRFPLSDDPFARHIHRIPLPGPQPNFVLPAGVALQPLVKNCYDHHYDYCPIEHE
ncbi:MAG TPA: hypothetical protein VKT72_09710 [Candidatus Baltobacteraceae bacterium]|nr:hypothetical protein [Candidatus Baltobacteraceae bacterium]